MHQKRSWSLPRDRGINDQFCFNDQPHVFFSVNPENEHQDWSLNRNIICKYFHEIICNSRSQEVVFDWKKEIFIDIQQLYCLNKIYDAIWNVFYFFDLYGLIWIWIWILDPGLTEAIPPLHEPTRWFWFISIF